MKLDNILPTSKRKHPIVLKKSVFVLLFKRNLVHEYFSFCFYLFFVKSINFSTGGEIHLLIVSIIVSITSKFHASLFSLM